MKKWVYWVLIGVFSVIFLVSSVIVIKYAINSVENSKLNDTLSSIHKNPEATATQPTFGNPDVTGPSGSSDPSAGPATPTAPPMLGELVALYEQNKHLVGWIQIEDTNVDYPVLQTPNTPEWISYYLYRDFYGKDDKHGSIYAREACDVFRPSDNLVLYGHNMADFSMFGDLYQYESEQFYKGHKYIRFDTLYQRNVYEIFAVFHTSGTYGVGFSYHLFNDAKNAQEFDDFISKCKELSFYDTGITPQYGDKLLTLSTCDFHIDNGRLVVLARRIN